MKFVAIHSVPRSGSTWLGSIFDSHPNVVYKHQPLFSYAFKDFLKPDSSGDHIDLFFRNLGASQDDFLDQVAGKGQGLIPSFQKEAPFMVAYKEVRYHHILRNMLEQNERVKVIGLIRNPLATLYSWWKAPREFRADLGWNIDEEWLDAPKKNAGRPEEFNGYNKWKEVALLFESLSDTFPDRFYLLRYSDLLNETQSVVKNLFEHLDLEFNQQTQHFITESKSKMEHDAYSVFKIKEFDRSWQGNLPDHIVNYIIDDTKNTTLEKYMA